MISTDFRDETEAEEVSASPLFDYATGYSGSLVFDASADQTRIMRVSGQFDGVISTVEAPSTEHHGAEAKFAWQTRGDLHVETGVVCRFIDDDNYVGLIVRHDTRSARLVERTAGENNTLVEIAAIPLSSSNGCSLRLEIIGQQARWWFEPTLRGVQDVPPHGFAALTVKPTVAAGIWGMYVSGSQPPAPAPADQSPGRMEVQSFFARNLPSHVAPPPSVRLKPLADYRLTPVTLAVTDVRSQTLSILWEVCPADPDDFAEVLRFTTVKNATSVVVLLRPGFTYVCRAREDTTAGSLNSWASTSILVPGTKPTVEQAFPNDAAPPVNPDYALQSTIESASQSASSDSARDAITVREPRPRRRWTLGFKSRYGDQARALERWFRMARGRAVPFQWVHPQSGAKYAARLDTDSIDRKITNTTNVNGQLVPVIDMEFDVVEWMPNAVGTITLDVEGRTDLPSAS